MKKLNLATKILFNVTLFVYGILSTASPILFANSTQVNTILGVSTNVGTGGGSGNVYYDTKFKSMEEVKKASYEIIEETMAEGAVLLKNDNDALPLSKGDKVSLYGLGSYYTVHTGQGSSGCESNALADRVTLYAGLTNAGLDVNKELNDWYGSQPSTAMGSAQFIGGAEQLSQYVVKDISWSGISSDAKNNSAKAAIMVLSRNSGEASDLYMDTTMDDGSTRVILNETKSANRNTTSVGDALALTENEKSVLEGLKAMKSSGKIENIVVIMNSASALQCDFVDDAAYGIDACLWVGTIGSNGADAIGKILTGEYNPSGRLSDTFWAESKYNPVYYNFGQIEYDNSSALKSYFSTNGLPGNKYYVVYQEGIYNGYKYTETRYEDVLTGRANAGTFDYSDVVSYPFGYGLSYTNFTYSNMKVSENDGKYTVTVDVKNNTAVSGKEVVQIYLQKPYTAKDIANGIEKASVELVGFDKVYVEGNGTATATITVDEKYFAAYDSNVEKTYVIGSDDREDKYLLTAAKDAHDAVNNILQYKNKNGAAVDTSGIVAYDDRTNGTSDLVWGKYIAYDAVKYSTNEFIEEENANFTPEYDGQQANYGVSEITNQFDDVDFSKAGIFSSEEENQSYMTRNNWEGTYGIRILLKANSALAAAQAAPAVEEDDIEYPTYDAANFYEGDEIFDEFKLIYLRGKDYADPLWDDLLDCMSYEETCYLLQEGLRLTNGVPSIAAPSSSQQNGAIAPVHSRNWSELPGQTGFRGFSEQLDPQNKGQLPAVFCCNGIVASTYNTDLIERLGEQTGEEAAWAGYNGSYGLGVNIHRGAYCGRTFEYYSEDGFLTGVAAGYEAVGMHKLGVFVLMKHAALNDQETHRAGINVWANEQSVREIYCRAIEVAVEIDRENTPNTILGVMTGMNRMGATWTGSQGFCNTVLRAEYGMRAYVVSDYNTSRMYMSPVQGVLNGNDLPDGTTNKWNGSGVDYDGNSVVFMNYSGENGNYGELAWAMRRAAHNILYTIVNSNTMNGIDGDFSSKTVTPAWQIAVPVLTRVALVLLIWSALAFAAVRIIGLVKERSVHSEEQGENGEEPKN